MTLYLLRPEQEISAISIMAEELPRTFLLHRFLPNLTDIFPRRDILKPPAKSGGMNLR
jgi:hypothetical protein